MAREDLPAGVVTLVFTDIEGSTRLLHALGDRYAEVLADQRRLLREAFAAGAGVEVDTQGDAFFFAFPEASHALAAVAQAQRALGARDWPEDCEVRVRMGVHTGEPLKTEEGYAGIALHQGARVMACAHGEQVVVSAAAAAAAGDLDGLWLRDLGEHRLRDLSEPQRLFQLCGAELREDFPPLKSLGGYFTNLPAQSSPLFGRTSELTRLTELLARNRLVTLTGPGGTGKTRLALQIGADVLDRFSGGVFFCDLAPLRDPTLVASMIANTIGLRERAGETSEQAIAAFGGEKALLLILDNFEQLLDAAPVIARLLASCPNVQVVATSRAPLRLAGELEFSVEPLSLRDAVTLFEQRARHFTEPAESESSARVTVEGICNRLDCLPLAIELAAARLRSLTPENLLTRLERRMDVLTRGTRDAPSRQKTLRATLDWSYDLLGLAEQQSFARLAVFTGGFTLDAAEQVARAHLDELDILVEQSLLRHGNGRYVMLETVREYALDQLTCHGEFDVTQTRHADWALGLLARADPQDDRVFHPSIVDALASTEIANLRQAIPLLIERRSADIASHVLAVGMTWDFANLWREGAILVQTISASRASPTAREAARAAAAFSRLTVLVGNLDAARESAEEGILAAEDARDDWALSIALVTRAHVGSHLSEPSPEKYALRALAVARGLQQPFAITLSLLTLGYVNASLHPDQARRFYVEALELAHQSRNGIAEAIAAYNLGEIDLTEQRYEDAEAHMTRLLWTGVGDSVTRAFGTRGLGMALAGRRSPRIAALLIGAGDAEIERAGAFQDAREAILRTAALRRVRAAIGVEAMHEALRAGAQMPLGDAVTLAMSSSPPPSR